MIASSAVPQSRNTAPYISVSRSRTVRRGRRGQRARDWGSRGRGWGGGIGGTGPWPVYGPPAGAAAWGLGAREVGAGGVAGASMDIPQIR